jgi:hypothetical protein
MPRLPGRNNQVVRLAVLVVLGILGILGARTLFQGRPNTVPVPPAAPGTDSLGVTNAAAFRGLRPREGDKMTPPRIGFRWTWNPDSARVAPGPVKFRVHLVSPDGAHEVSRQVSEPKAHVNLRDSFPTGKCEWWVEAIVPGSPPIRSAKQNFLLEL